MRVRDVMASPVVTVAPDAALKEVASLLVERRINAVPVVDAGDRLIGIVSEADLLSLETGQVAAAGGAPPHSAGEVMRQSVYTVTGDTDATAAARLMLRHRLKSVPVVDADQVVGMVTRRDLLRLLARSDEDIRADLERRVAQELEALRHAVVEVRDGVVTVDADGPCRQLVEQLARAVPGVVEVRSRRPDPAP
ncbi:MAG TPA: CBS domain-containing protein [Actinomycetota bacterium]|nr:CBS domain-containing protein [Actinomycetota bacterium]